MASFQFDSGRSHVFGDIFAGRQAPIGSSDSNSALLDRREWPSLEISVPELESDFPAYASEAVEVRNTFIHVASPTAEADHADRPLLSCPANIGWIEDLLEDRKDPPPTPPAPPAHPPPPMPTQKEEFSRPVIRLENALEAQTAAAQADAGLQVPQVPLSMGRSQGTGRALGVIGDQRGRGQSTYMLPTAYPSTAYPSGGDMPVGRSHMVGAIGPVASVQAAPAPAPGPFSMGQASSSLGPHAPKPHGTKELPSVGSAGHALGTCRPCAFLYAKGCFNGAACSFCHLCDRGEKKRRQKQKKAWFKGGA